MDAFKQMAGRAAADMVKSGMVVGLGTGSTAAHAIRRLGERIRIEGLRISGIPTSNASGALARDCGIPLTSFEETTRVDLTIDGADEVDPASNLVKGGGGALLREKVVACRSASLVIIVDPSKLVEKLAAAFPLPVEVVPFASRPVAGDLRELGGEPALRIRDAAPFVTDNGNWILDTRFPSGIDDPAELERRIAGIAGAVESGLFVGLVDRLVIGRPGAPEVVDVRSRQAG